MSVAAAPSEQQQLIPYQHHHHSSTTGHRHHHRNHSLRSNKVLIVGNSIASVGGKCNEKTTPAIPTSIFVTPSFTPLGGHTFRWRNSPYIFPDGTSSIVKTTSLYEGAFYAYLFTPISVARGSPLSGTQLANLAFFADDPQNIMTTAPDDQTPRRRETTTPERIDRGKAIRRATSRHHRDGDEEDELRARLKLGEVLKPATCRASEFELRELRHFVPRVHSIIVVRDELAAEIELLTSTKPLSYDAYMRSTCYVEMENLESSDPILPERLRPTYCAMDLKIGTRLWGLDAGKEKRERMNRKAQVTTAAKTGLCLIAYKCVNPMSRDVTCQMTRQETRKISTAEELYLGLRGFFSLATDTALKMIKNDVKNLLEIFRRQTVAHFHSSSLLVIYDSSGIWPIKLKLIDFEHASFFHSDRDESFLTGLTNFSNFLNTLHTRAIQPSQN